MSVEDRLGQLNIVLPAPPRPVANYVPACQVGDLLFISGVLPFDNGQLRMKGKLGRELTIQEGYESARLALLNALAIVKQHTGALDRVKRIVRLTGYVASASDFVEQPAVVNGASDLLVELFGDSGRHARLALGAAELPMHAPVELELIVQLHEMN
ncbi:MAG: RidA family protein [Nitrospirae bacterium]|nr:MAG: RidA family protein [Nitrospirota bacterium]